MRKNVGFIGLGIMGAPMAGHLMSGGHQLFVFARKAVPQDLIAKGAIACKSIKAGGRMLSFVTDVLGRIISLRWFFPRAR